MKKFFCVFILMFIYSLANANTYIETKVDWKSMKVIEYDIKSEIYDIQVLKTSTGEELSLMEILDRNNAISWVNWVFFCPSDYSYCKWKEGTTNNERYVKWEKFSFWPTTDKRAVFAWDQNKSPFIYQDFLINPEKEKDIYYWLSNRPLLLLNWEQQTEFYWEYGLIDNKMKASWTRNFICSNQEWTKITFWMVFWVNIDQLAIILKNYWCYNAINLDAWLSTAMVYNWRYLMWPQRDIIDAVGIVPKFDTTELNKKADVVAWKITAIIDTKHPDIQLKIFDKYMDAFTSYRTKLYTKHSNNIYDENWKYVWYRLDMNDLQATKMIYLVNKTHSNLLKYRKIYKEMIDEMKASEALKIQKNKESLKEDKESLKEDKKSLKENTENLNTKDSSK